MKRGMRSSFRAYRCQFHLAPMAQIFILRDSFHFQSNRPTHCLPTSRQNNRRRLCLQKSQLSRVGSILVRVGSCDFVDRSFCPGKERRSMKSHELTRNSLLHQSTFEAKLSPAIFFVTPRYLRYVDLNWRNGDGLLPRSMSQISSRKLK
jgi:hypothetical protein